MCVKSGDEGRNAGFEKDSKGRRRWNAEGENILNQAKKKKWLKTGNKGMETKEVLQNTRNINKKKKEQGNETSGMFVV